MTVAALRIAMFDGFELGFEDAAFRSSPRTAAMQQV